MPCSAFSIRQKRSSSAGAGLRGRAHSPAERAIARLLIAAIAATHPLSAGAGQEFQDADHTTHDASVHVDNGQAGQTTFTIDSLQTTIDWAHLHQPANNRTDFLFTQGSQGAVLNRSDSPDAIVLSGQVHSNGTVAFANPYGVFIDGSAVIDVGSLVAVAANVPADAFASGGPAQLPLEGRIENHGLVRADQNVALLATSVLNAGDIVARNGNVLMIGGQRIELGDMAALRRAFTGEPDLRTAATGGEVTNSGHLGAKNATLAAGHVLNLGEIEIEDGTLMMLGADGIYLKRFEDPVLTLLPRGSIGAADAAAGQDPNATNGGSAGEPRYAVENRGQIDAGRGHVRLAAADPLGFGIRQGSGGADAPARIRAKTIELAGGEHGRVLVSGELDASDRSKKGRGGRIDVSGELIGLEHASLDASGRSGGGQIRLGGEQQGGGDFQRARALVVDTDTTIRADALHKGNGGRIIAFSEDLTAIDGTISARGGKRQGDGGFVETSGLGHFRIADLPDVTARHGQAGQWLIDPYDITISNAPVDCNDPTVACLDPAIAAILDPLFDSAGFDGVLRTSDSKPDDGITPTNYVSADLIERALGIGANVTLSTQVFGDDPISSPNCAPNPCGNITIADSIAIDSLRVLAGTRAALTLLAAGNIVLNPGVNIEVIPTGSGATERSNLALSVALHANDSSQTRSGRTFARDLVEGGIELGGDIRTSGGSVVLSGVTVHQAANREISTRGGSIEITSGTVSPSRTVVSLDRSIGSQSLDDDLDAVTTGDPDDTDGKTAVDTYLFIEGKLDTRAADVDPNAPTVNGNSAGGRVTLTASSVNVGISQSGKDPLEVVTGLLRMAGQIVTGGGKVALSGGSVNDTTPTVFAGNVDVTGSIDSRSIDSRRVGGDVTIGAHRVNPDQTNNDFTIKVLEPTSAPGRGQGGTISVDGTIRTGGGSLGVGNQSAQTIRLNGIFDTTSADIDEFGLMQLIARDVSGNTTTTTSTTTTTLTGGRITLGDTRATTVQSAGLTLRTRDLEVGASGGANAVDVVLSNTSSSTLFVPASTTALPATPGPDSPKAGVLDVETGHSILLHANTEFTATKIGLTTAKLPLDLTASERSDADSATRLRFEGANGAGVASDLGVRLNADEIRIAAGDGPTPSSNLFAEDLGTATTPTDLAITRQVRGTYQGLQLRDRSGALRPNLVELRQDGDLTITQGAPAANARGELDLAGAFGTALIGNLGLHTTLASNDGTLRVADAAGFNDNPGTSHASTSDAGKSFVELLGGLLLPAAPTNTTNPLPSAVTSPNSVVFGTDADADGIGDQPLGTAGSTAFSVASLKVSTPGDLSIGQQIATSIASVWDLVFESGRDTAVSGTYGRGSMTIAAATALGAGRSLTLEAARSGFGNLVFAGAGTSLAADDITLSAAPDTASQNSGSTPLSFVSGLTTQSVALRDATGAIFGDAGSSAIAFRYRQVAGIDAAAELPTLAQFGLAASGPNAGFRATGDVGYAVQSDSGSIDLDDGVAGTNEADAFRNASLSLVGLQGNAAAVQVSNDTAFVGRHVEIGSTGNLTWDANLARAFNRSGTDAQESLTLRAGSLTPGLLAFASGVTAKAPTIRLVAGDGEGEGTGSVIDARSGLFDLAGPVGTDRTFVYQTDGTFQAQLLPATDRFVGGAAGLPNVLAIRNDGGALTFDDFDVAELPLAVASGPARLVLEADTVELNQTDGNDLDLTSNANFFLRLRANTLNLIASVASRAGTETGRVHMGPRVSDTQRTTGTDADFAGESLLVEAFDPTTTSAATGNLSSVSETASGSGLFDLALGRGPTKVTLTQDGSVQASDLARTTSFSGLFARSLKDTNDDTTKPIATTYSITSTLNPVAVEPENVNGSRLVLSGRAASRTANAIDLAPGTGANPGRFTLAGLNASTEDTIVVRAGTQLIATDAIVLAAGVVPLSTDKITAALGQLRFDGDHTDAVTRLQANQITLTAGPSFDLVNPDENKDGKADTVDPTFLPKLVLSGLDAVSVSGKTTTSFLQLTQSAGLDARRGQEGDIVTALEAGAPQPGAGGAEWARLDLTTRQGDLRIGDLGVLADETSRLVARAPRTTKTFVDMPNQASRPAPFDDFVDGVRFETNDITFQSSDPGTSINLANDRLVIASIPAPVVVVNTRPNNFRRRFGGSQGFGGGFGGLGGFGGFGGGFGGLSGFGVGFGTTTTTQPTATVVVGRLRDDIATDKTPDLRPIVRIHQAAPFTNTQLPRPTQYATMDTTTGLPTTVSDLTNLDIELVSTTPGATLTFDDGLRGRTAGANLILRSAGDVAIAATDRMAGFENLPLYAAFQLESLDIETDFVDADGDGKDDDATSGSGTIRIDPFTVGGSPADLTLETAGDQRYGGKLELANTYVTTGRKIDFDGDVVRNGPADVGLVVGTTGRVRFEGNVGDATNRLDRLWVLFQGQSGTGLDSNTPAVEFGKRSNLGPDADGDGKPDDAIAETPVASNQSVYTRRDIVFLAGHKPTRTFAEALGNAIDGVLDRDSADTNDALSELDVVLRDANGDLSLGRDKTAVFATVGKALGDLRFDSQDGLFLAGPGEKVAVGGDLTIETASHVTALSDASALSLVFTADQIGLLRRNKSISLDVGGQSHRDGGPSFAANSMTFRDGLGAAKTPTAIGTGRDPHFGLPDPFAATAAFPFLQGFSVFEVRPRGQGLTTADFTFEDSTGPFAERVAFAYPAGASRSDLSGAYGPVRLPTSKAQIPEPLRLAHPGRLSELAVSARPTPDSIVLARLTGAAVIDDRDVATDAKTAVVTEARLDTRDAEAAIALHDRLFGPQGEHADHLRSVLQHALDEYLETHRSQRVVGFELRRFVKNRPSTLLDAYTTLEDLDALFRYHRRLGLSPGEFKRIQRSWLEQIQPDGITVEELSETIHPSRYVRGSDILDIFGQ